MNVFQGRKIGATKQIRNSWAPFFIGVHCIAHRANLAIQYLGNLILIAKIEMFMMNVYGYFNHSLKRHSKFQKLT